MFVSLAKAWWSDACIAVKIWWGEPGEPTPAGTIREKYAGTKAPVLSAAMRAWVSENHKSLISDPWFEYLKRLAAVSLVYYATAKTHDRWIMWVLWVASAITCSLMGIWVRDRIIDLAESLRPFVDPLPWRARCFVRWLAYSAWIFLIGLPSYSFWATKTW